VSVATETRRAALDQRLQDYHGATLERVLEMIDYLRDPGDSVLAGGSLTSGTGMGNQRSDLDVVICGKDSESSQMPLEHWLDGLRIDAWKRKQDDIDEVFERARKRLASDQPFHGAFGDVEEQASLKFLHRIAYGIILDGPALKPTGTWNYQDVARDLVVREYAERMRESAFVAQLSTDAGNSIGATLNARAAVEDAMNATVTSWGMPFTDNKWLRERLANDASELEPLYRPFAVVPDDGGDPSEFVGAAFETCQGLTGVEMSRAALLRDAAWLNTDLKLMKVGDAQMLLSTKEGGLWRLEDGEVTAWEGLEGEGPWHCTDCDEEQIQLCFQLYSRGLVKLRWARGLPTDELDLQEAVKA
jgi:hypothetical protein